MPIQLVSGRSPVTSACTASDATYGASRKNRAATSFCARPSAAVESIREPVKHQTMIALAKPSIAESIPKPINAIELARMPAKIATDRGGLPIAGLVSVGRTLAGGLLPKERPSASR